MRPAPPLRRAGTQEAQPATAKRTRCRRTRARTSTVTRTSDRPAATRTRRLGRSQRGTNALMIDEILKAAAPNALRPAEIRKGLQDNGVTVSFASIRYALAN